MNSGKTLDNDSHTSKVTRLKCSMFSTAALTIVSISHNHPTNTISLREEEKEKEEWRVI